VTTRSEQRRREIQESGAECWIGTPERLATLKASIENVSVVCWLLGTASGTAEQIRDLHTSRLEFFLGQIIDSTVRGFVYEPLGCSFSEDLRACGTRVAHEISSRNSIPLRLIQADPEHQQRWLEDARAAIDSIIT
jgi:hypothetical protein